MLANHYMLLHLTRWAFEKNGGGGNYLYKIVHEEETRKKTSCDFSQESVRSDQSEAGWEGTKRERAILLY